MRQSEIHLITSEKCFICEAYISYLWYAMSSVSKYVAIFVFQANAKEYLRDFPRGRVNREVQTVNWEAGKKGAVETGVNSGLKKAWIRGKKGAQTVN